MCMIVICLQVFRYLFANSAFFLCFYRFAQVGDFADANSWPTPGEIATKDMQVAVYVCLRSVVSQANRCAEDTLMR